VEVLDLTRGSGLYIQGSGTFPWRSGLTVDALEYIIFFAHVAAPEPSTWWGQVLFTTRLEIVARVPRLHTVVRGTPISGYRQWPPGPTSGEDTSLQVGPKLDRRLVRHFHAFADVITASPPSVTPTVMSVPAADWPTAPTPDGFAGPCARRLHTATLVLKNHLLCLPRWPRGGAVLARAAVRSFCTQEPMPKEYDLWAWAPMS
jgi:hypothetical protein